MATPSDEKKSIVRRLTPSQRTLVALLAIILVTISIGPGLAQQSFDFQEDFEDGDTHIEESNWDGWDSDSLDTTTSVVISGSQSANLESQGSTSTDARATRDQNTTAVQEIEASVLIDNISTASGSGDSVGFRVHDTNGDELFRVQFGLFEGGVDDDVLFNGASTTTLLDEWQNDTVYHIRMYDWDFGTGEVNVSVSGGGDSAETRGSFPSSERFGQIRFHQDDTDVPITIRSYWDDITVQTEDRYSVTGRVTDQDTDGLSGVTVRAEDSQGNAFTADTNRTGHYEITELANETYTVETRAAGYLNESESVTIDGASETQDFQLLNQDQSLRLDVRKHVEHGQSVPYTVTATYIDSGSSTREEVTDTAIVTSGNTSIVTVDEVEQEITGTNDRQVNARTYVQANWTAPDGEEFVDRVNVTVANLTVDNLDILPPWARLRASLAGGTEDNPNDRTVMVIIIATAIAAATAYIATSFAGIGALTMVVLAAWVLGHVDDGVVIACVLMSSFVGLNLAGNVDYTVRKG